MLGARAGDTGKRPRRPTTRSHDPLETMKRTTSLAAIAFLLAAPLATAQFADEAKFNDQQASKLHKYAEKCFKKGFPLKAKRVWLQLLAEYDPDHTEANEALGNAKAGNTWGPRPGFKYPKEDTPNPSAAKALRSEWGRLAKALGGAHGKLAGDYAKAGRDDRARYHYERVIRYIPDDANAKAALNHKPVEGLSGTDLERTLYDRSKLIDAAIAEQFKVDYPVEILPDTNQSDILRRGQVEHRSVKSEHFIFRGDFEPELLVKAAQHAERAIRVVAKAFDGYPGYFTDVSRWPVREELFVASKETFQQCLDANSDVYVGDQDDFKFTRENSSSANFRVDDRFIGLNSSGSESTMFDSAVRSVARGSAGLGSTAMNEGIGHTIVGMFFNKNQLFSIDRQRQLETSTEDEIEYNSPNFDEWKDLALEAAWKKTGQVGAAELTLFQAHNFPNEARIKAWSFTDYLVRRDPELVKSLDALRKDTGFHNPIAIAEKFAENNEGLTLAQLEKEWRDYWTEASPVLKAIRNNTPPLEAVSKDVKKWLNAFNEERKKYRAPAVTWSASYSGRCAEHAAYLRENKDQRGPALEQGQDSNLPGATHLGNMFAQMALVETKAKKPDDIFEEWQALPGYRDALLNPFLTTVGIYAEKGMLVMETLRGRAAKSRAEHNVAVFPNRVTGMPHSVKVADLGPELQALLEKHGHGGKKVIGLPITYHCFYSQLRGDRNSYRCQLTDGQNQVEGILHVGAAGGSNRHTSAPGMAVFYPLEPLDKGKQYKILWTYTDKGDIQRVTGEFST